MKKGASHVDWAISMGLFLVFIVLTLIFLKPGAEPIYKPDTLLKIIEDGLKEEGSLSLDKGFLGIELTGVSSGTYKIRLVNPTEQGLNPDWAANKQHLGLINSSLGVLPDELLRFTPFDLYDEYCNTNPSECLDDVLDIETYLFTNKKNILWLVYSEDEEYDEQGVSIPHASTTDPPDGGCFIDASCLLDGTHFTYEFGAIERLRGFSEEKLSELETIIYNDLKDEWGVPLDKEFRVKVTNLDKGINFFNGFPVEEEIPKQMNVFVKEWDDWLLTSKGTLIPVEVHIELW